ncbi:MAG TPA: hypothetical protein VGV85_03930 [Longimicrobiaceae bacterium]|nr:hypothetical protein [Longimicrobiaceae bacterium]
MRKFKLDLDQLSVESFDTTPDPAAHAPGTVFGFADSNDPGGNSCVLDCSGAYSCGYSCDHRCTGGGDWTYPPHATCDQYENTCAVGCMW